MTSEPEAARMNGATTLVDDADDSGSSDFDAGLFAEPEGFRPPSPPRRTRTAYTLPKDRLPKRAQGTSDKDAQAAEEIPLDLVGFSPLWGHHLWNAAPVLADYLLLYRDVLLQANACLLELGAAAGLPGIVAAKYGGASDQPPASADEPTQSAQSFVVTTDYPDPDLLACLQDNLAMNGVAAKDGALLAAGSNARVEGYIWGSDPSKVLSHIAHVPAAGSSSSSSAAPSASRKFDLLLLSDLIFNHQAHAALLDTCAQCLRGAEAGLPASRSEEARAEEDKSIPDCKPEDWYPADAGDGAAQPSEFELPPFEPVPAAGAAAGERAPPTPCVLVFYTHHRPHLAGKDLAFFARARLRGWKCRLVVRRSMPVMFAEDAGSEAVRGTVWGWCLTRSTVANA